ncbi:spindle assembly abnormal protein 6 [Paragonimus westermani]|uniref:Spindle assembly abnormal protein 6 n=1 Tax=Paragonimus westermani TaxID=34504 RepID=A0A5J4NAU9_9TREM|nr:spindle assembly abnormal protein 6 [Paragonimus westermani]
MGYSRRHLVVFEGSNSIRKRLINVTFEAEQFVNSKNLLVRLSDEDDLYFLYSTCITDEEFNSIKMQQGLLVDFAGFSQKVIDLLGFCSEEEDKPCPKYILKFFCLSDPSKQGTLQIVEATNFKYLTHLSLNLCAGDNETLKAYLAESKAKIDSLEKSLSEKSCELSESKRNLRSLDEELTNFKASTRLREETLRREFEEKLTVWEEKYTQAESRYQCSLVDEQQRSSEARKHIRDEFGQKLRLLKEENKQLGETRDQLLSQVKLLTGQLGTLEDQATAAKEELMAVRSKLRTAEQANESQTTTLSRLESRLSVLEQELIAKDQLITRTQDLLTSEQEAKSRLQEELQLQTRQAEKLQNTIAKDSDEVKKANEIIKHLQADVKTQHTKAKLRGQVAAEQERLLSAKEAELQERQNDVDRLKGELKEATDSTVRLNHQIDRLSSELAEAQKTIKTNENIISWLNRQISENQIGQVQQRLKATGFPTPIMNAYANRPLSPPQSAPTNGLPGLNIAPPWQPTSILHNPCSTMISRLTNIPCCTTTAILTSSVPSTSMSGVTDSTMGNHLLKTVSSLPVSGGKSVPRTVIVEANNPSKNIDALSAFPLAPMTKSTPLHPDYLTSSGVPSDAPSGTRSTAITTSSWSTGCHSNSRLPSYVPSALLSKPRLLSALEVGSGQTRAGAQLLSTSTSGPDDTDLTVHQQSLTSAYFPKPVGTNTH